LAERCFKASQRDSVVGTPGNGEEFDKVTAIKAPPRAGRREWIGLAVLSLACVLYVMDLTVLYLALPPSAPTWSRPAPSCCGSSTSTGSSWPGR
jgi:hypothetical protein